MHLWHSIPSLVLFVLALAVTSMTKPLDVSSTNEPTIVAVDEPATYLMSHEQMLHWLATTDAKLTFIGKPINPLAPRSSQSTILTFCTTANLISNTCGGSCTAYNGGPQCLNATGTSCLAATANVGFCDTVGCVNHCHDLANCGTRLGDQFCYTPGTEGILVCTA